MTEDPNTSICPACEGIGTVAIADGGWVCANCGATGFVDHRDDDKDDSCES